MAGPVALIVVHDDCSHLVATLRALGGIPKIVVVNKSRFSGPPGNWQESARIAESAGAQVFLVDERGEAAHRQKALQIAVEHPDGYTHALVPDSDEILDTNLRGHLLRLAEGDLCDIARVTLETYFWDCEHVVRPRENIRPVMMVKLGAAQYLDCREWRGARDIVLSEAYGLCHHPSWVRSAEFARRKVETWGHAHEARKNWFIEKFLGVATDNMLRHLNPVVPEAYDHLERIPKPSVLELAWDGNPKHGEPEIIGRLPRTEAVIVTYGGEDIFPLLDSLRPLTRTTKAQAMREGGKPGKASAPAGPIPLLEAVTVVDNASPDGLADRIIALYPWVRVIKCTKNLGFAAGNNVGVKACAKTTEAVLLLNSDTVVCRSGLIPMFNTYNSSGSVGLVGARSNAVGYRQLVHHVTPGHLENLELFCQDFSHNAVEDVESGMVVCFAALVRKSLFEELGGFSEDFYPALWEDTDLSHRVQMAKYRCMISGRSFVLHKCSRSLGRMSEPTAVVMSRNETIFRQKHRDELECGFASHLAGDANSEPVRFEWSKHPDVFRAEIRRLAPVADCGLSIICGDKPQEVMEAFCNSIQGVFTQKVAYLNNCKEPARMRQLLEKEGFEVIEGEFVDFAYARNQALKPMRSAWIMTLDADDILPLMSALSILRSILSADPGIGAFRLPIQFPRDKGNTRVDHCKVMRNDLRNPDGSPAIAWDYEIHEQWVHCATRRGLRVEHVPNAYVLHLNYDVTPEGQAAKRVRDVPLLLKAVQSHPDCPYAHWNMGMTLEDSGDLENALGWLDKSIALSTPSTSTLRKVFYIKARALRRLGRHAEAESALRAGLSVYPNDIELNFGLAELLIDKNAPNDALACLDAMQPDTSDQFGSIDPDVLGPKRRMLYAKAILNLDRYREAADELRKLTLEGVIEAAALLYEAGMNRREFVVAEEALSALLRMTGPDERWCIGRMNLAVAMGQPAEAALYGIIQSMPGEPAAYVVLSRLFFDRGEDARAMPLLQAVTNFGISEGPRHMGIIYARRRQLREALNCYIRTLEIDPNDEFARSQIGPLEQAIAAIGQG